MLVVALLIFWVDVKSAFRFVAIRPTLALEFELGMKFDWQPLTLDIPSHFGWGAVPRFEMPLGTRLWQCVALRETARPVAERYRENFDSTLTISMVFRHLS